MGLWSILTVLYLHSYWLESQWGNGTLWPPLISVGSDLPIYFGIYMNWM